MLRSARRPLTRAALADPRLLVVAAATLWGTTGTARALGPADASPTAVGAARMIVGAASLVAAAHWTRLLGDPAHTGGRTGGAGEARETGEVRTCGEPGHGSPGPGTAAAVAGAVDMAGVVDEAVADTTLADTRAAADGPVVPPAPALPKVRRQPRSATMPVSLVVAALALAAYQPLFFGGVARTGVAVGTVVGIGSSPVFAGVLGLVVRGERTGGRWMAATALALAGTALLVGTGSRDEVDPAGIALALGAGLAYAVYALGVKLVLDRDWPADTVTVRALGLAGLVLVPVALVAGIGPLLTPAGLVTVLHLGVITVAVAYVIFGRGLHGVGVGAAGTLTLAEPATAATLGVVVLGERFGGVTATGVGLVVAGLVVLVVQRR